MNGKPLSGVKSMHINSLACVRVKEGESKCFRIEKGVRKGCIMSSLALQRVYGCNDERGQSGDCLVSCMQMTRFCVMSRRKT